MDKVIMCSLSFCHYVDRDGYFQGGFTFKCSDCPYSFETPKEELKEWLNKIYGGAKDGRI